jgi:cytochrome P450
MPLHMRRVEFDPAPELAAARDEERIKHVTTVFGDPAWLVTRYADVREVLGDAERFKIAPQGLARLPGAPEMTPEQLAKVQAGNLLGLDPPEHTRLRRMLTPEFTIRRMRRLEPRIKRIVDDHLDAMEAAGSPADLVPSFALPIPSLVICELLGVPYEDRDEFQERSALLVRVDGDPDEMMRVSDALTQYMVGLVMARQAKREDDLLSRLITRGEELGEPLTLPELVSVGITLLIAGHETTANMIALSTLALLRNPAQLDALRADPTLAPAAAEELLRYLSVVQFGLFRHVTDDLPVGPSTIEAGGFLIAALSAANRDESVFPEPDRLDLERQDAAHIAFGFGPHQCLGQQLARVELQEVFTRLYARIPTLRLAVPFEEIEYRNNTLVYGVTALPVTWDTPATERDLKSS